MIPDAVAQRILGEQVPPALDQGGAGNAAAAAAWAIQKTLNAAGVKSDRSARPAPESPPAEIKLFAVGFVYMILMFVTMGVLSKRPNRVLSAVLCVGLCAIAAAVYVWAAGNHPVGVLAWVWLLVPVALAVSFAGHPPPVGPRKCKHALAATPMTWQPWVPDAWVSWLVAAAVIAL